jgi:hypothetical protein
LWIEWFATALFSEALFTTLLIAGATSPKS